MKFLGSNPSNNEDLITKDDAQAVLVNETNIKSVDGGQSLLGSGGLTTNLELLALQALGSAILGQMVGAMAPNNITTSNNLTDNNIFFVPVYLPKAATLTGVKFYQSTQGNFTGDQTNSISLFSYSGGTKTKVAESANDANIWKGTSNTWQTVAFASTYVAAAGLYFVGFLYNQSAQTTAPALGALTASANAAVNGVDFTNSAKLHSSRSGQNTVASTYAMSLSGLTNTRHYAALY
jgi:hypothetical protein